MPRSNSNLDSERRKQARLEVQIPIQLQDLRQATVHSALLIDLSWGGALCQTSTELPIANDQLLRLRLPWHADETIEIDATLLRQKALESDRYVLALRFQSLSIFNQTRLEKLLGQLHAGEAQNALHNAAPLVATLDVQIQAISEWRGALTEIAKGQLQISAPIPCQIGQSVALQFNGVPARARLRLRARVLNSAAMPFQGIGVVNLYLLTLEFEHPLKALQQWAEWLLNQAANMTDWHLTLNTPPATDAAIDIIPAHVVLAQNEQCALEIGFPEMLDYLMTFWGDIAGFEMIFGRLSFGDLGMTVNWTPEAWEELQFLQDVHDRAYGISSARSNPLKMGRDISW